MQIVENLFAVVRSPISFSPKLVAETQKMLQYSSKKLINLFVRSIITKEASSAGWLHQQGGADNQDFDSLRFPGDSKGLNQPTSESSSSTSIPSRPSKNGEDESEPNPTKETKGT